MNASRTFPLANGGTPCACIVIPDEATPVEVSAARELHRDVKQISGAKLAVVREGALEGGGGADKAVADADLAPAARARRVYVGATRAASSAAVEPAGGWPYDAIAMKARGDDLFLCGHPVRGPLYAVYAFLEDVVGVRWWTDSESRYPVDPSLAVVPPDVFHAPPVLYRETFYRSCNDPKFRSRMRLNFCSGSRYLDETMRNVPPELGGDHRFCQVGGRSYHTFYRLIPPDVYFQGHPEWFSLVDGRRTCERAQLCLSNREMEAELVRNALRSLRADPSGGFIQISQNDNAGRCQCPECLAAEEEDGGVGTASGPLLRFVNRVAGGD